MMAAQVEAVGGANASDRRTHFDIVKALVGVWGVAVPLPVAPLLQQLGGHTTVRARA